MPRRIILLISVVIIISFAFKYTYKKYYLIQKENTQTNSFKLSVEEQNDIKFKESLASAAKVPNEF